MDREAEGTGMLCLHLAANDEPVWISPLQIRKVYRRYHDTTVVYIGGETESVSEPPAEVDEKFTRAMRACAAACVRGAPAEGPGDGDPALSGGK